MRSIGGLVELLTGPLKLLGVLVVLTLIFTPNHESSPPADRPPKPAAIKPERGRQAPAGQAPERPKRFSETSPLAPIAITV